MDKFIYAAFVLMFACCNVNAQARDGATTKPEAEVGNSGNYKQAVIIPLDGPIVPALEEFLRRRLADALENKPDLLILAIDSPGGYLSVMDEMIQQLDSFPDATTAAYIHREALSAAAIIALSCDKIILGPDARFGDAGPLVIGPDAAFRYADAKTRSDLIARVRTLAARNGRPEALVEAMVDKDVVVFEAIETATGDIAYFTEAEWDSFAKQEEWERGLPVRESRADVFLEVNSGPRAVTLGLADATAADEAEMLRKVGFSGNLTRFEHSWVDSLATILASPIVTVLLVVVGLIGLLVELGAPGIGYGGLTSVACFGLFFWSRFLGGTAGWLEVAMLACGALFLAAEIFVLPGFGIAGVTGIGLILLALLMAMRIHLMPESTRDLHLLSQQVLTLTAVVIVFFAAALIGAKHIARLPIIRQLTLIPMTAEGAMVGVKTAMDERTSTHHDPTRGGPGRAVSDLAVGNLGVADSPLRPSGRVRFDDLMVDVVTEGDFVDPGKTVRIISRSGVRVVVRAVDA